MRFYEFIDIKSEVIDDHMGGHTHNTPLEKLSFLFHASFVPFWITSSFRSELMTASSPSFSFLLFLGVFESFWRFLDDMSEVKYWGTFIFLSTLRSVSGFLLR